MTESRSDKKIRLDVDTLTELIGKVRQGLLAGEDAPAGKALDELEARLGRLQRAATEWREPSFHCPGPEREGLYKTGLHNGLDYALSTLDGVPGQPLPVQLQALRSRPDVLAALAKSLARATPRQDPVPSGKTPVESREGADR